MNRLTGFLINDQWVLNEWFERVYFDSLDKHHLTFPHQFKFLSVRVPFNDNWLLQSKIGELYHKNKWLKTVTIEVENLDSQCHPTITCAVDQLIFVKNKNGFIRSQEIRVGDELLNFKNKPHKVKSVRLNPNNDENVILDIGGVRDNGTFFVNGWLVCR